MPVSLVHALSSHLISEEECKKRYSTPISLSARLLGRAPIDFFRLMSVSELLHDPCAALLRSGLNIPSCEVGLSSISSAQRRMALFEASRTHGTPYCTSHCAAIGDILKGSFASQCLRAGGLANLKNIAKDGDELIRNIVHEACSIPARTKTRTKEDFLKRFGSKGLNELALMVSFMGWLNFCNDIAGMELEKDIAPISEAVLSRNTLPSGVPYVVSKEGDGSKAEMEASLISGESSIGILGRLRYHVRNVIDLCKTIPALIEADSEEQMLLKGIPHASTEIHEWLLQNMGCELELSRNVTDPNILRAIAFCCRHVFLRDTITPWSQFEKLAFFYVFGKQAQDTTFVKDAIAIFTGQRLREERPRKTARERKEDEMWSNTATTVEQDFDRLYENKISGRECTDAFSAALYFVANGAGHAGGVSTDIMTQTIDLVDNPGAVVDLVAMCGIFAMLHRLTAFLKPPISFQSFP